MKRFNWWLVGLVISSLAVVLLVGCGVPQADYDELNTEYTTLQADYDQLNTDHEAVEEELAEIK